MEKILFYHGGPGLNSNPEKNILTKPYRQSGLDLQVWNEPSALRGTFDAGFKGNRFEQLLQSAEKFLLSHYEGAPLCLMGSSIGCQVVTWLLQKHPERIKLVVLSGPCFHIFSADRNIFSFSEKDYLSSGNLKSATALRSVIQNLSGTFDDNCITGWQLTANNPVLFNHYWYHPQCQADYYANFIAPEYVVDFDAFFETRKCLTDINVLPTNTRTIALLGLHDTVIAVEEELDTINKNFTNATVHQLSFSSHFPHIDEKDEVLKILIKEAAIPTSPH